MIDLAFILLLTVAAAGLGLALLDRLGGRPDQPSDALAMSVPLGLGTLALAALGLGEAGALSRPWLAGLLGLGVVLAGCRAARPGRLFLAGLRDRLRAIGLNRRALTPALSRGDRETFVASMRERDALSPRERAGVRVFGTRAPLRWQTRPDPLSLAFALMLTLTLLGTLLTAMAPVTDGDALCYHLQVPKVFLARGAVGFEPDLHESVYPLVTELLFAYALAFRGPVACRLVSWVLGLTFAANVTALARPSLGVRAWWAGAIALLVPAISNGMGAPLNDVALAAFGMSAIAGWVRFRDRPSARAAVLAGVLNGLALGVKYPALVLAGLLGLGVAGVASRGVDRKKALLLTTLFAGSTLVVGGGWYLRAWCATGNPVYPFFRQVFGGSGLDEVLDPIKRPMAVNVGNVLTALGPLTLEPDRFDSFAHQFGPVFLWFLPALLLERPPRRVLGIVAIGYAFLTLCLTQRQSMRFVLIAVGPMSLGVAWLATRWRDRRSLPGSILVGLLAMALGFEASLAVARARHGLAVVLGRESADAYLDRREPTFRVGRWMAAHLPEDARVVGQDHRGFYLPRPYTMELAHRRRTGLGRDGAPAGSVADRLRGAGFTHVLFCPPAPGSDVEFDPTLGRLLAPWLSEREPLYREEIADADGVVRRYALYALDGPRLARSEGGAERDRR